MPPPFPNPRLLDGLVFTIHAAAPGGRPYDGPAPPVEVRGEVESAAALGVVPPDGPAGIEAFAALVQRSGARVVAGEKLPIYSANELLVACRKWGEASVRAVRREPSLLSELTLGSWPDGTVSRRALRRLAVAVPVGRLLPLAAAADAAFWRSARREATRQEWRRLTSGCTVLLYHRLAGEHRLGQERLDVSQRAFDAQMQMLRALGFRMLGGREAHSCSTEGRPFPRRSVVVTVDDACADVIEPLRRHADLRPQLFVPTADPGRPARWLDGVEIASWSELRELAAAGVELGGHGRTHVDLTSLPTEEAAREIRGAADDLVSATGVCPTAFAYPHGHADARERRLAAETGYAFAYTTATGRNGPGTDPYALRRVSVKAWDTRLSFVWKLLTGEQPPAPWERWLIRRWGIAARLARGRRSAACRAPTPGRRGRAPRPPEAP